MTRILNLEKVKSGIRKESGNKTRIRQKHPDGRILKRTKTNLPTDECHFRVPMDILLRQLMQEQQEILKDSF